MANNTGLRLVNTTSETITIDLFDQGQSGDNVPQEVTQATNGVVEQPITSTDTDAFDNPWYTTNGYVGIIDDNTYRNFDPTLIQLTSATGFRKVQFSDDTYGVNFPANATLQEVADEIVNGVTAVNGFIPPDNVVYVNPILQIKRDVDSLTAKIGFEINYTLPIDSYTLLVKNIVFSTLA